MFLTLTKMTLDMVGKTYPITNLFAKIKVNIEDFGKKRLKRLKVKKKDCQKSVYKLKRCLKMPSFFFFFIHLKKTIFFNISVQPIILPS